jgi:hypothetical protein
VEPENGLNVPFRHQRYEAFTSVDELMIQSFGNPA